MKLLAILFLTATLSLTALDTPVNPPPETQKFLATAQIRVDVLMVSVPENEALKLLATLRDSATIEAAQKAILELIAEKKAVLLNWPEVTTHDRVQAVTESIIEKRYQSEWGPNLPGAIDGDVTPSSFEVKNVGATIQVAPVVSPDGKSVTLELAPLRVAFVRMDEHVSYKPKVGPVIEVQQPVFATSKVNTTITLRDGERRLIYAGKVADPGTHIEFFIVGVKIIPPIK